MTIARHKRLKLWQIVLFSTLSLVYLLLLPQGNFPTEALIKAAPIIALLGFSQQYFKGQQRLLVSLALIFSGIGDVVLTMSFNGSFPVGLSSFLIAQVIYASLFFRGHIQRHQINVARLLAVALLLCHALYFASLLLPVAGDLAVAILAYLSAISLMGLAAVFYAHSVKVFAGAISFIVSDTLIAVNKFLLPFAQADLAIMLTYYLAQLLIFQGLLASVTTSDQQHD